MKKLLRLLLFLLFPCIAAAQQRLDLSLTFGTYYNDHAEKKFHADERTWKVLDKKLTYLIDANGVRYSDSLKLTAWECEKIVIFIKDNDLLRSTEKELKTGFKSIFEYREEIRGNIYLDGKTCKYNITANGSNVMEKYAAAKSLMELEQIFYRIIENHR